MTYHGNHFFRPAIEILQAGLTPGVIGLAGVGVDSRFFGIDRIDGGEIELGEEFGEGFEITSGIAVFVRVFFGSC